MQPAAVFAAEKNPEVERVIARGLEWLAAHQSRLGHWTAANDHYPTSMTALAATALLCEGSTTTQGKYAANINKAVEYLVTRSRANGLIGDPLRDDRYTYGHGFSMLFLSQVLGEEEDAEAPRATDRRSYPGRGVYRPRRPRAAAGDTSAPRTATISTKARPPLPRCRGCAAAATPAFPCPRKSSTRPSSTSRNAPARTAACATTWPAPAAAAGRPSPRPPSPACSTPATTTANTSPSCSKYCKSNLENISNQGFGHWHYAHYYYSQVLYREGGKEWEQYRDKIFARIVSEAGDDGSWNQGYIGTVYTTATNLIILQIPKGTLPIYQR